MIRPKEWGAPDADDIGVCCYVKSIVAIGVLPNIQAGQGSVETGTGVTDFQ